MTRYRIARSFDGTAQASVTVVRCTRSLGWDDAGESNVLIRTEGVALIAAAGLLCAARTDRADRANQPSSVE